MPDENQSPSNPPASPGPFQPATVPAPAPPLQAQPQAPAPSAPTPLRKKDSGRIPLEDSRDQEIRRLRADLGDAKFKLQTANERIVELENEEPPEPVIRYRNPPMTLGRAIPLILAALVLFTAGLLIGHFSSPKGERVEVPVDNPENLKEIELLESQVASLTNEKSSLETEVDRLEAALAEASKPAPAPVVVQPQVVPNPPAQQPVETVQPQAVPQVQQPVAPQGSKPESLEEALRRIQQLEGNTTLRP